MPQRTFYRLCILLCTVAYAWLGYQLSVEKQGGEFTPCFSKLFFHLPCPACGTTRGILFLLKGRPHDAFLMNPNAYLVSLLLLVVTALLVSDGLCRTDRLYRFYLYVDRLLHRKILFTCIVLLEAVIWAFHLYRL